jgi:hypothetical protein
VQFPPHRTRTGAWRQERGATSAPKEAGRFHVDDLALAMAVVGGTLLGKPADEAHRIRQLPLPDLATLGQVGSAA